MLASQAAEALDRLAVMHDCLVRALGSDRWTYCHDPQRHTAHLRSRLSAMLYRRSLSLTLREPSGQPSS